MTQAESVTTEKRNRNVRLDIHEEEALLRAAEDYAHDNASEVWRKMFRGELPDAVTLGYLCGTCYQTDCNEHEKLPAAIFRPRPFEQRSPPAVPARKQKKSKKKDA